MLLKWVQTVCWAQAESTVRSALVSVSTIQSSRGQPLTDRSQESQIEVKNFTESFCDGRVLCLLLSWYHPTLLAKHEIQGDDDC